MFRAFFGLRSLPFGKDSGELWNNGQITGLKQQFDWLIQSPGIGLLTAAPGLGKTAALREIVKSLNKETHKLFYISDTDFGRLDFYRQLAVLFGLTPSYRLSQLWADIKEHIIHMNVNNKVLPILIIDEAHNLPLSFFRDLPSFLNFVFDSKDYMTVWLVGHPELVNIIDRPINTAIASRINARYEMKPILDKEEFKKFVEHGLAQAGLSNNNLFSDTAIEKLRMYSKGNPRQLHQVVRMTLQLATDKKEIRLSENIIDEAMASLKVK